MIKGRRWLLAAALVTLILGACTSPVGPPGAGSGKTRTVTGSASAAPGHRRLSAVRHVWVIELENQGYVHSFGAA